jgi:hypothetical protein
MCSHCASATTVAIRRPAYWAFPNAESHVTVVVENATDARVLTQTAQELEAIIEHGPNPHLHIGTPAEFVLRARFVRDEYSEHVEMRNSGSGRNRHTTRVVVGHAASTIALRLEDATGNVQGTDVLEDERTVTGPRGPVELEELRSRVIARVGRYIEPTYVNVEMPLSRCMQDSRCRRGIDEVEHGALRDADESFTEVVDTASPQATLARRRRVEALWDRAIVRAMAGDFPNAGHDLDECDRLWPGAQQTLVVRSIVQALALDDAALRAQGLGPAAANDPSR